MKARVCQLFEVFQHEFTNFSLPCEGRLTVEIPPAYRNFVSEAFTLAWVKALGKRLVVLWMLPELNIF